MKDPAAKFKSEVERRKKDIIDDKIETQFFGEYVTAVYKNLRAFRNRIDKLRQALEHDDRFRDPCNLFVIKKENIELQYNEK